mmetsp:Transcript_27296/g.36516  ORF Transcript_27296/g.36516 Transcript_27296/m.36516 type:complete len:95 (+) Transcript_27296:617-901(+)
MPSGSDRVSELLKVDAPPPKFHHTASLQNSVGEGLLDAKMGRDQRVKTMPHKKRVAFQVDQVDSADDKDDGEGRIELGFNRKASQSMRFNPEMR